MAKIGEIFVNLRANTAAFTKGMNKARDISFRNSKEIVRSLKKVAAAVFTMGAAFTAFAVKAAADFEEKFANVATLLETRTPKGAAQVRALQTEILALNPALGSSTELTEGLYQALSAGAEPAKAVKLVGTAAKFAKAAITSTTTAVDVGTTVMNAYGESAGSADQVFASLFETIKQGKTTGEELAGSIGKVIPAAAALKVPLAEINAAVATLTKGGFATSVAVTSVQATLKAFIKPTATAEQELSKLGLSAKKMREIVAERGLSGALKLLKERTGGNVETLGKMFESQEALTGVLALTGAQAEEYEKILVKVKQATEDGTATNEAFEKQASTLKSRVEELKNAVTTFATKIGVDLTPALSDAVKELTNFISSGGPKAEAAAAAITASFKAIAGGALVAAFALKVLNKAIGGDSNELDEFRRALAIKEKLITALEDRFSRTREPEIGKRITRGRIEAEGIRELIAGVEKRGGTTGFDPGAAFQILLRQLEELRVAAPAAAAAIDEVGKATGGGGGAGGGSGGGGAGGSSPAAKMLENLKKKVDDLGKSQAQLNLEQLKSTKGVTPEMIEQWTALTQQMEAASGQAEAAEQRLKALAEAAEQSTQKAQESVLALQEAGKSLTGSLSSGLADVIIEGDRLNEVFGSILRSLARMAVSRAFQSLFGSLLGSFGGGGSGSTGLGIPSGPGQGLLGGAFAHGGRPPVGQVSLVGERGPEAFIADRPGTIIPNHQLAFAGGGGSNVNFNIDARGADVAAVARLDAGLRELMRQFPKLATSSVHDFNIRRA